MPGSGALANVDPAAILTRYLAEENTAQIASSLGVHRSAIHQLLLRLCPDQWRETQAAKALTAYEEAKDALDLATDALSLARAREQVRTRQWELERLLRRLYGPSQEITGAGGGPITVEIVQFSRRTLEGEIVGSAVDKQANGALSVLCQVDNPAHTLHKK